MFGRSIETPAVVAQCRLNFTVGQIEIGLSQRNRKRGVRFCEKRKCLSAKCVWRKRNFSDVQFTYSSCDWLRCLSRRTFITEANELSKKLLRSSARRSCVDLYTSEYSLFWVAATSFNSNWVKGRAKRCSGKRLRAIRAKGLWVWVNVSEIYTKTYLRIRTNHSWLSTKEPMVR